ncbi:MAG: hypothetical protein ABIH46_10040, partial [Chloroflexota bacterium]
PGLLRSELHYGTSDCGRWWYRDHLDGLVPVLIPLDRCKPRCGKSPTLFFSLLCSSPESRRCGVGGGARGVAI